MAYREKLDPDQLQLLANVLDDVCIATGIPEASPDREEVAALVMYFYDRGYRDIDELRVAMEESTRPRRYG
jgi:hypothetical protein